MKFRVMIAQTSRLDGGVNLSRRNARMAEHLLDRPQISSTREQVRRKGMTQTVWLHVLRNTRAAGVFFHNHPQHDTR